MPPDAEAHKRSNYMLKVSTVENKSGNAKARYNFHSENLSEITFEKLVGEMAANNTTVTKADIMGVLDVYKSVAMRYLLLGYSVRGVFGLLHVTAGGTADDMLLPFEPKLPGNDHSLNLRMTIDNSTAKEILDKTETERVTSRIKMMPVISLVKNAYGNEDSAINAGDTIRIIGEYIKFAPEDKTQGVFLEKDGVETRLDYCTWNTGKRIDARIPADLEAGDYTVLVKAKPNTIMYSSAYKKKITVS